ncbi:helix-turn-helix domain-containing protein [Azorhizobium doebereinerae]|uniref:helix-turn-helix domain-containing protein n=1 Tax=Azorhizobium doebereinerae TaxID=281091 RepID=UPI00048DBE2A|nr:helix-turn-helix transcriptional regulator [Azorhizobium doebereinerae]
MTGADIGARFAQIRVDAGAATPKAMSDRLGIGENAWREYEKGKGTPSWATLQKLAALGYDLSWLMTGQGNMRRSDNVSLHHVDPEFMGRLVEAVVRTHKELGINLPEVRLGHVSAEVLADVFSAAEGPDEYPEQLELMIKRLKRRLKLATEEPGTGKRSA